MKILLTDIFFRKTYDVINILCIHYPIEDFIFTLPFNSRFNRFKLRNFYKITHFEILSIDNFDDDLIHISKKYKDEKIVYLPIEEKTTLNFLNFIEINGEVNFSYLLPSLSNFKLSRHKAQLNLFCEKKSISCPKYISQSDLKNKNFRFPIIKKPSLGSGANGIVFIENEKELSNCEINFKTDFVQERLPNPKGVQAGFYLCKQGEVVSFYSHKRIRTHPETGGVTVYSKSSHNNEIKTFGAEVLKELNWSGFVMIEFLYDERDGLYKLIEINPRLWGSILLSEFCGASFLCSYIKSSLGETIEEKQINTDKYIRWVFPYDIIYYLKHLTNPFKFYKKQNNTCYINFTYSSGWRSLNFIFFSYINLINIKKILKIDA